MEQLTPQQGKALVKLARHTIEQKLDSAKAKPISAELYSDPVFHQKRGVFVTLQKRNTLRGCIGSLSAEESIFEGVQRHALNAAFHDHRFKPVTREEAEELHVEVSVLTTPRLIEYASSDELLQKIVPGRDGIILKGTGEQGATFLPQVWKQLPDPMDFFSRLCQKAGLPGSHWQTDCPEIQTYQVQLFEEPR